MMPTQFPQYGTQTAARSHGCGQCSQPFTPAPAHDDGYPPGRGRWRLTCAACSMSTWFDLIEETRP